MRLRGGGQAAGAADGEGAVGVVFDRVRPQPLGSFGDCAHLAVGVEAVHLVAKGNVAAPRLEIQDGASLDSEQRTMANPDLTVEVRGGRIVGVEARLHVGK